MMRRRSGSPISRSKRPESRPRTRRKSTSRPPGPSSRGSRTPRRRWTRPSVNSNRLRPRRLDEPDRRGGRRAVPPKGQAPDRTGLYVGLAVGGGVLVLALAFAMSSGGKNEPGRVDRSADKGLKEDMEAAQRLAGD